MNKKNVLFFLLTFFIIVSVQSQGLNIDWLKSVNHYNPPFIGNGNHPEMGKALKQTNDGGYILAGSINSGKTYNSNWVLTGNEQHSILVRKMPAINSLNAVNVVPQWELTITGNGDNWASDIIELPSKMGYIVVGSTTSTNITGFHNNGGISNWADVLVARIDLLGNLLWTRAYGTSGEDKAFSVVLDNNGGNDGVIIAGKASAEDGDAIFSNYHTDNSQPTIFDNGDFWIFRIGFGGVGIAPTINWNKAYGGTGNEEAHSIISDGLNSGDYIVTGITSGPRDHDVVVGAAITSNSDMNAWTIKIHENNSSLIWANIQGGTKTTFANDIVKLTNPIGNVSYVIAGYSNSQDGSLSNSGYHNNTSAIDPTNDGWICALDNLGGTIWNKLIGGKENDLFSSIVNAPTGDIVLCGSAASSDGDLSGTTLQDRKSWIVDFYLQNGCGSPSIQSSQVYEDVSTDAEDLIINYDPLGFANGFVTLGSNYATTGNIDFQSTKFLLVKFGLADKQLVITPNPISMCIGSTKKINANINCGSWTITNGTGSATIDNDGLITPISAGQCTITYSLAGFASVTCILTIYSIPSINPIDGLDNVCVGNDITLTCNTNGGIWGSFDNSIATITSMGVVSGLTAGTTTITYNIPGGHGCSSSVSKINNVNDKPNVTITGNPVLCMPFGSTTLMANASPNVIAYQWLYNGLSISNANGTSHTITTYDNTSLLNSYSIEVTNTKGCKATSNIIKLVEGQTPMMTEIGPFAICVGNSISLVNQGKKLIWNWSSENPSIANFTNPSIATVSGISSGNTTVHYTVTTANGCSNTGEASVTVNALPVLPTISGGITTACVNTAYTLKPFTASTIAGNWSVLGTTGSSISATGIFTAGSMQGIASVIYKITDVATNCSNESLPSAVNVIGPISTPITGPTQVCAGSTIQLSNATTGGNWSSSNLGAATVNNTTSKGQVTGVYAGTTTIKYTVNNGGCSSFVQQNVNVYSLPGVPTIGYAPGTPNPQIGAPTGSFCTNKTFTVVGNPTGGVWSKTGVINVTTPGGVITTGSVAGAGTLKYTYTDGHGCSNSRTMSGNIVTCVARGVNTVNPQLSTVGGFTIYPNPAKSQVNINVETLVGNGNIVITDLYGKTIKMQALSMGSNRIDVSNLSKGFYLVSVITSEGKTTQKLIIE